MSTTLTAAVTHVHEYSIADGDQLLLCTDGLTNMVDERLIESILLESPSAQSACRAFVNWHKNQNEKIDCMALIEKFPPG